MDIDKDIDSDMAVSINWGEPCKVSDRAPLEGFWGRYMAGL